MIADRILAAFKAYIESQAANHPVVDDWTIVLRDADSVKDFPLVVLSEVGSTEHPVLRGVQAPLTVEAALYSVPNADGATSSGTAQSTHQSYAQALFEILNDTFAITCLNATPGIKVHDIRGGTGETTSEDSRLVTRILSDVVCQQEPT